MEESVGEHWRERECGKALEKERVGESVGERRRERVFVGER